MKMFDLTQWLLMGCLFLSANVVMAQEYPSRVVRIVVGNTAGASSDIAIRLLAQKLTASWGQQVIVDNRPGANGIIGAEAVAKAKPDGYTLLTGVPSLLAMNQFVYKKLPYDTLRDFAPISQIATNHFALVVTPALPTRSVAGLVRLAKSRPGEMLFASSGVGNQNHLSVEMFAHAAGIKITHVPHKGAAPALVSVMGGHAAMQLASVAPLVEFVTSGKLRLLATAGTQRAAAFPDTPTLVESGYPDVVVTGWTGLLAPTGVSPEILDKVSRDVGRVLMAADVRSALAVPGTELTSSTPEAFGVWIRAEADRWGKVIRAVGLAASQ